MKLSIPDCFDLISDDADIRLDRPIERLKNALTKEVVKAIHEELQKEVIPNSHLFVEGDCLQITGFFFYGDELAFHFPFSEIVENTVNHESYSESGALGPAIEGLEKLLSMMRVKKAELDAT